MTTITNSEFPYFLQSYENLRDHLTNELDELNNTDKGKVFAKFIANVIPTTEFGAQFGELMMGKLSHDGGIDLTARSADGKKVLHIQCKLTLKGVDDFDLIMSKFSNRHDLGAHSDGMLPLFDAPEIYYIVATLSKINERVVPQYESSMRSSRNFYDSLKQSKRIQVLDGPELLPVLQAAYRKLHMLPANLTIRFEAPFISRGNVYISIVSANELRQCYTKFGDSLFLENIRTFLGYSSGKKDQASVNDAIKDTAANHPEEMLARNNGISFRAQRVRVIDNATLELDNASIVNGLQTTMSLVKHGQPLACVLVKIVEVPDAWAIAKSANFQNRVDQIALDLARYVRPQAVKIAASRSSVHVDDSSNSVFDVFEDVYRDHVRYDEIYYIFMAIFSRTPNNAINKNYTELRDHLLKSFQDNDPLGERTFNTLFRLYISSKKAQEIVEKKYTDDAYRSIFQRFWKDNKPDYRSLITVAAACICVKQDIYKDNIDYKAMDAFMERLLRILENDEDKFIRHYQYAFEAIASYILTINSGKDETQILRTMYDDLRRSKFDTIYKQSRLTADGRENSSS